MIIIVVRFYKGLFFSLQHEALKRVSTVISSFFFMKGVAQTSNICHITRKKIIAGMKGYSKDEN